MSRNDKLLFTIAFFFFFFFDYLAFLFYNAINKALYKIKTKLLFYVFLFILYNPSKKNEIFNFWL